MEVYQLEEAVAERIYRHLWIYSHGIAALCATKMCRFTKDEIEQMMAEVFRGTAHSGIKGGKSMIKAREINKFLWKWGKQLSGF